RLGRSRRQSRRLLHAFDRHFQRDRQRARAGQELSSLFQLRRGFGALSQQLRYPARSDQAQGNVSGNLRAPSHQRSRQLMEPRQPSLPERLRAIAAELDRRYLGKSEVIRLLLISIVAREHAVVIGPPGTAKSALIRSLAELLDARYFEYLLTRFSEPNELFGPVDIQAFREGVYRRRTQGMLPEA